MERYVLGVARGAVRIGEFSVKVEMPTTTTTTTTTTTASPMLRSPREGRVLLHGEGVEAGEAAVSLVPGSWSPDTVAVAASSVLAAAGLLTVLVLVLVTRRARGRQRSYSVDQKLVPEAGGSRAEAGVASVLGPGTLRSVGEEAEYLQEVFPHIISFPSHHGGPGDLGGHGASVTAAAAGEDVLPGPGPGLVGLGY